MKTILLSVISIAWGAGNSLWAQPASPPDEPGGKLKRPQMQGWKTADANHDGALTFEEFSTVPRLERLGEEKRRKIFARLDKNRDGKIDHREMMKNRKGSHQAFQKLWERDADQSGGISLEEFCQGEMVTKLPPEQQMAIFKRLDQDGDGQITRKDRPQKPPGKNPREEHGEQRSPEASFLRLDENKDGTLSFEEFRKSLWERKFDEDTQEDHFLKMDRNQDEKITREEFSVPRPAPKVREKEKSFRKRGADQPTKDEEKMMDEME